MIAQGRTNQETLAIAGDVAKKLIEAQSNSGPKAFAPSGDEFDYPLIVATWWVHWRASVTPTSSSG